MLQQIALGSILVVITTAVHALCTAGVIQVLRLMHADRWAYRSGGKRISLLSAMVLMLFLAALFELSIWAAAYLAVGAIPDVEPALYFSTVTFTTLGYGDLTLDASWRLLGSFEAANGTLMFGWSTAIVVAVLHRMVIHDAEAAEAAP
jgi:hypothetical protein